jgi:hypothetical protein
LAEHEIFKIARRAREQRQVVRAAAEAAEAGVETQASASPCAAPMKQTRGLRLPVCARKYSISSRLSSSSGSAAPPMAMIWRWRLAGMGIAGSGLAIMLATMRTASYAGRQPATNRRRHAAQNFMLSVSRALTGVPTLMLLSPSTVGQYFLLKMFSTLNDSRVLPPANV